MNATTLLLFSFVALVAIATSGPTVLLALSNGSRWLDRASGGALLALAGSLAFYRRANS